MAGILANSVSATMTSGDTAATKAVTGYVEGEEIALTVSPTGTDYVWAITKPTGSTARSDLSSDTGAAVTFTPEADGYWLATCVVDSTTTYRIRIAVTALSQTTTIGAHRFSPIADASVPTPAMGATTYYSSDAGTMVEKRTDGGVYPLGRSASDTVAPVRLAAAGNVADLNNAGASFDGVAAVASDRVLLPLQSSTTQNGVYVVASLTPTVLTRAADMPAASAVLPGVTVAVQAGDTGQGATWTLRGDGALTVDTDALVWSSDNRFGALVTALRATPGTEGEIRYLKGYTAAGDGGEGAVRFSITAAVDDDGHRFNAGGFGSNGAGWQRVRTSSEVFAEDFGFSAAASAAQNATSLARALLVAANGALRIGSGTFSKSGTTDIPPHTSITGDGRLATVISQADDAPALRSLSPLNSSTGVFNRIVSMTISSAVASTDGGIVNVGGTFFDVFDVQVTGFKYGVIYDQAELSEIDLCDFEGCTTAGVWLVNGADYSPGASAQFTNRISISRCQFNAGAYGVVDDGGYLHAYRDNNFNGQSAYFMRVAGTIGAVIEGSEMESTPGGIKLSHLSLAGNGVGQPIGLTIRNNVIVPSPGFASIEVESCGQLLLQGNLLLASGVAAAVTGCTLIAALTAFSNAPAGAVPLLDAAPTFSPFVDDVVGAGALKSVVLANVRHSSATGSPEATVVGSVGDVYHQTDGGAGTTFWVKESGTATDTGWTAQRGARSGDGSPEGVVDGTRGTLYVDTGTLEAGEATLWVAEQASGNTGWRRALTSGSLIDYGTKVPVRTAEDATTTAGDTETTALTYTVADAEAAVHIVAVINCKKTSTGDTAIYKRAASFKAVGGTVTQVGTTDVLSSHVDAALATCAATIDNSGDSVRVRVTGITATDLVWSATAQVTHDPI